MKRHRDVGQMGEAQLVKWCAEQGITPNRAYNDRTGWDYLLEFPSRPTAGSREPLDRQPAPLQCFIQVKSTDRKEDRISAKLTNWLRLVNTPFPAFFLLLQYHGKSACQRACLVEVSEPIIREVLKKLRLLSSDEKARKNLHRKTHSIACPATSLLATPTSEEFARRILTTVGEDPVPYAERKSALLKSVGYEGARAEIKVDVIVPESYRGGMENEMLVDLSIGTLSHLDVERAEVWDVRFGIKAPEPVHRIQTRGKLEVHPVPAREEWLLVRSVEHSREVRVPAKVFFPSGLGAFVTRANFKVRIALPNANIVLAAANRSVMFNVHVPPPEEARPLSELSHTANLLLFMADASDQGWTVEWVLGQDRLGQAQVNDFRPPPQVRDWATLVSMAHDVVTALNLPSDTLVTPVELWPQRKMLDLLHIFVTNRRVAAKIRFSVDPPLKELDTSFFIPQVLTVTLGTLRVVAVVGHIGRTIPSEQASPTELVMNVDETVVLRKHTLLRDEPLPLPEPQLLQEAADAYASTHNIVRWWGND